MRVVLFFFFALIFIGLDFYCWSAIKLLVVNSGRSRIYFYAYWAFNFVCWIILISSLFYAKHTDMPIFYKNYVLSVVLVIYIVKLFLSGLLLIDDLRRLGIYVYNFFVGEERFSESRNQFLLKSAVILSSTLLGTMIYGVIKGAFDFYIFKHKITSPKIPLGFNGFRVVQISDLHVGSFVSPRPLERAVKMINDLKPDVILFTGDLVNNIADEIAPHFETLKKLKAKHGIYSVLGNHDYGDYVRWNSQQEKSQNFQKLINTQKDMGWNLLMDDCAEINLNGESINIIGIQNWSAKGRFPKYGNLEKAYNKVNKKDNFNILLSHDPSHWKAEVTSSYKVIDLTLSGHTHGMQFGVEIPYYFKWSPVKYIYEQWAGMYSENGQNLYVNRGLGFIGYPGRVGIKPEITLFNLHNS